MPDEQLPIHEAMDITTIPPEMVPIDQLRMHPKNYVVHPEDQLKHLVYSLWKNGFYRNIVVAADYTILAGHGIWMAAQALGMKEVPVVKLTLHPDSQAAIKILIGDNESRHLAVTDDRSLTELLVELSKENDLDGTGYDQLMLAAFAQVTRVQEELLDLDDAKHWVGMPGFERVFRPLTVIIHVRTEEDRMKLLEQLDLQGSKLTQRMNLWWPPQARQQLMDIVVEPGGGATEDAEPAAPAAEVQNETDLPSAVEADEADEPRDPIQDDIDADLWNAMFDDDGNLVTNGPDRWTA